MEIKKDMLVAQEIIESKVLFVRGKKIMLDKDLAVLYAVETRDLNKAVTRNLDRFPEDFCFRLTKEEFKSLMFQNGTSKRGGTRKLSRAFTEHGILMLSSVLNSPRAISVNIQIMRTFTRLREMLASHGELKQKIEKMEKKYDYQFRVVFDTIKKLLDPPEKPKTPIGFHVR